MGGEGDEKHRTAFEKRKEKEAGVPFFAGRHAAGVCFVRRKLDIRVHRVPRIERQGAFPGRADGHKPRRVHTRFRRMGRLPFVLRNLRFGLYAEKVFFGEIAAIGKSFLLLGLACAACSSGYYLAVGSTVWNFTEPLFFSGAIGILVLCVWRWWAAVRTVAARRPFAGRKG